MRRLNRCLNLEFIREEVAAKYGHNGQVSVDPVVIMKMMLLLFLDDVKSERELMRIVPLRLDYLYFLGYGLEDTVPNHSVLSKARQRWGSEVFEHLFARTVEQCAKAGLIGGDKVHVDASLIRADASLNCVVVVEKTLSQLSDTLETGRVAEPQPSSKEDDDGEPSGGGPINDKHTVQSDPDATVVRHRSGKSVPSYKNHRVLDDLAGVITAIKTTTGCVPEGGQLMDLVEQHEAMVGRKPRAAIADSAYGTSANFIALAESGIRAHVADLRSRLHNVRAEGIYPAEAFAYDAKSDSFRCPANQRLFRHHYHAGRGYHEYRAKAGVCAACPLARRCTRAKAGRTLKRYEGQELLDRARRQSHGPAAQRDRRRRQWFQERNFGEAAVQHGFKRSRWRSLRRQQIQDLLIAAIQNLKIYLRKAAGVPRALLSAIYRLLAALRTCSLVEKSAFYPSLQVSLNNATLNT